MFKTCFVARVSAPPKQRAYICCRLDPSADWQSPPAENLLAFCFPLGAENVRPREYMRPEEFSFTLTAGNGSRLHGFCRRTLPPRKAPAKLGPPSAAKTTMMRYPQVLCIVSQHPWFPFFYKALELVEKMLRQEDVGGGEGTAAMPPAAPQEWPRGSPAAAFLSELLLQLGDAPRPGQLVRVRLPPTELPLEFSPPRRALTRGANGEALSTPALLHADSSSVELEVPPDLGLGAENAGISAARLLFFLPPRVALTLIASLLMERRIILVASAEDKVSAAVHAAAALIYPFRWQHIYLPLLPMSLKDYLAAPMPYLVGLNSECLPMLRTMAMEEVLIVDLDLGECSPPPDGPGDDAFLLPYASLLLSALETCKDGTLSSTEFNSTPFIASVMQEYLLKLVGKYRLYIQPDSSDVGSSARSESRGSSRSRAKDDDTLRAHGFVFDQATFVAQRKSPEVREFLSHFRHSQMFEVFVTERLRMAAAGEWPAQDTFEAKVTQMMAKQAVFGASVPGMGPVPAQSGGGRFAAMLKKTANAMRQSSDNLVKGLKQLGSTQEESYVSMPRRSSNSFAGASFSGLQRVSPVAGLHPAGQASALKQGHSRTPSLTQLAPRSPTINRASPSQPLGAHHKAGAVVSLEDVKPDLFFGGIMDDDAGSEASEGSAYSRSGNSSPGPLEQVTSRSRGFASLFRLSASQSAAPSPRGGVPGRMLQRDASGKSSSSPSLVSLDVSARPQQQLQHQQQHQQRAASGPGMSREQGHSAAEPHRGEALGPGPPSLIDLSSPYTSLGAQSGGSRPAEVAPVGVTPALDWPPRPATAGPVRPHALGASGGSGAFGSPLGAQTPAPHRLSNLHGSSVAAAPLGGHDSLSLAILGVLSDSAAVAASAPSRHSTASANQEWDAFAAASLGQSSCSGTGSAGDRQQLLPTTGGDARPSATALRGAAGAPGGGMQRGLGGRAPVKQDAFGSLLADTFCSVNEELAVRRRTSSQDRADAAAAATRVEQPGGGPADGRPLPEQAEASWADFGGAGVFAAGSAGEPLQRELLHSLSWEWVAPAQAPDALAADLAQNCTLAGAQPSQQPDWAFQ